MFKLEKKFHAIQITLGIQIVYIYYVLTPIQDRREKPSPPTSFSPVTSANIEISSQKRSGFQFELFCDTGAKREGHT